MFSKTELEKYADVMVWALGTARKKPFVPNDVIQLGYELDSLPLVEVLYKKLIQKKYIVLVRSCLTPVMEKDFFTYSNKSQRAFLGKWERTFIRSLNGFIFVAAPTSLTHLKDIDPKRLNETAIARKPLKTIKDRQEELGLSGWTLCRYPTKELAVNAKLSLEQYKQQIIKACFLNEKEPVKKWKQLFSDAKEIEKWLTNLKIKRVHLESRSCDIRFSIGPSRQFLGISGHNIPSFEIFTSPDWRGTNGIYFANQPSFRDGNLIKGVKLEFKDGNIVKARALKGDNYLQKVIKRDEGAKRVGEFSLTDKRFSKIDKFMADTLFDENYGGQYGNCHIAIGSSFSSTYKGDLTKIAGKKKRLGFNDSSLHWDLINIENKKVTAILKNGKSITIYENGVFQY